MIKRNHVLPSQENFKLFKAKKKSERNKSRWQEVHSHTHAHNKHEKCQTQMTVSVAFISCD